MGGRISARVDVETSTSRGDFVGGIERVIMDITIFRKIKWKVVHCCSITLCACDLETVSLT